MPDHASDVTLAKLRSALTGRYEPERAIGRGGMATVFVARDARHNRQVAIKVLHPELAVSVGADRFLAEIAVTARLQHPHILPLHESAHAEGLLFYVMPFVDGESLRGLLDRTGALPVAEAVRIANAVAGALDYAHRQGVVHRDIKPENILLSDGVPIVADFGIARALDAAGSTRITYTGVSLGTPAYMSPEQASGDADVGVPSDVYSLGCVLFEMLSGQPPFPGVTAHAILVRRFTSEAPSLAEVRPDVPNVVAAAVRKALARDPADRFATAAEFAAALTARVAVAAPPATAHTSFTDARGVTLAVLPFANLSADRDTDYFCDGMTDEVLGALARLRGVRLASRTSTLAFKGKQPSIGDVGKALNVSMVLEGSVRQSGEHLRVSTQLVEVTSGFQVWSGKFDRQMAEVFAVQDEIAAAIADALRTRLTTPGVQQPPEVRRGTQNLDAYHLVLKGRHFWNARALDKAMECFQKAVALDPNYAQAYSGLADGMSFLSYYAAVPPQAAVAKGRGAAQRAVVCDPLLPAAHYSLGLFEFICGWDLEMSGRALERALELDPQMGQARATRAQWLACFHRRDEARFEGDKALSTDPLSPLIHATVAWAAGFAGEASRGIDIARSGLDLDPHSIPCLWVTGGLHVELGAATDAIEPLERALELSRRNPFVLSLYGNALAHAGRAADARAVAREIDDTPALAAVAPGLGAVVLAGLGDTDAALERLAQCVTVNDPRFLMPLVQPVAGAAVRSAPRYAELLDAHGLSELRLARS